MQLEQIEGSVPRVQENIMGSEYSGKGGKVMRRKEITDPSSHCFSSWENVDASKNTGTTGLLQASDLA